MRPDEGLNSGCEWRAYEDAMAYLVVCDDRAFATMKGFIAHAKVQQPAFDGQTLRTMSLRVAWRPSDCHTQYL